MESLVKYLVYKNNPLRYLGIIGLKELHLEADQVKNRLILDKMNTRFGVYKKLSNIDRSLAQFLCQESLYTNAAQKIISKILFSLALPFVAMFFLLKSFKNSTTNVCDVFVFEYGDLDYVRSDFKNRKILTGAAGSTVGSKLGWFEINFLFRSILKQPQYLLHPKLLVNILRWLSAYAWVVRYCKPKTIVTFFEGTASCSLLTEYLHCYHIQHWNYAHGEHFKYDCYSAYANFDRYVIWGEFFKNIQVEKNCQSDMFFTRAPDVFKRFYNEIRHSPKINNKHITVLIHSGVQKGKIEYEYLLRLLRQLNSEWTVLLRPHPVDRSSWPAVLNDLKKDLSSIESLKIQVKPEYPEVVPMQESVQRSSIFVGSASAALLEALLAGCKIIYLPGRIKNKDILERHQGSLNILYYNDDIEAPLLKEFLETEYLINDSEDNKINYLFELKNSSHVPK